MDYKEGKDKLRSLVLEYVACYTKQLAREQTFLDLLEEGGKLAGDIARKMADLIDWSNTLGWASLPEVDACTTQLRNGYRSLINPSSSERLKYECMTIGEGWPESCLHPLDPEWQ